MKSHGDAQETRETHNPAAHNPAAHNPAAHNPAAHNPAAQNPPVQNPGETPGPRADPPGLPEDRVLDMELIISRLLQVGVYTSSAIILIGMVLMVFSRSTGYSKVGEYHLQSLLQYHAHRAAEFPINLSEVAAGAVAMKPFAIIMLGVLLLIATPVLRVAVSLVAFILERDRAYSWITCYVLVVLIVSFLIGRAIG